MLLRCLSQVTLKKKGGGVTFITLNCVCGMQVSGVEALHPPGAGLMGTLGL